MKNKVVKNQKKRYYIQGCSLSIKKSEMMPLLHLDGPETQVSYKDIPGFL